MFAERAMPPTFLETPRLRLTSLVAADASPEYLAWLNDADVLRYRAPKAFPTTEAGLRSYIDSINDRGDLVLAIRTLDDERHIGNVALNSILWVHRSAELSIMIGARDTWSRGYGREVMSAVVDHAFSAMGLHRVWAESPNPAFNRAVSSLGWTHEGTKRDAFLLDGRFVDMECYAILASERGR